MTVSPPWFVENLTVWPSNFILEQLKSWKSSVIYYCPLNINIGWPKISKHEIFVLIFSHTGKGLSMESATSLYFVRVGIPTWPVGPHRVEDQSIGLTPAWLPVDPVAPSIDQVWLLEQRKCAVLQWLAGGPLLWVVPGTSWGGILGKQGVSSLKVEGRACGRLVQSFQSQGRDQSTSERAYETKGEPPSADDKAELWDIPSHPLRRLYLSNACQPGIWSSSVLASNGVLGLEELTPDQ